MYADYENCLTNLACSILKYYGAEYNHETLPQIDSLLNKNYKNVVVLLFDGMGIDALNHHLDETSFLRQHLLCSYSSVFPPTTTAATTAIESGLNPCEHGWLGWSLYFSEIDKIVNAFINTEKDSPALAAPYHVARRYLPYKSIYEKIDETGNAKAYSVYKYGRTQIEDLDDLFDTILGLCENEDRNYIYGYWEDPDSTMHDKGCYDKSATDVIKDIDRRVEHFCKDLKDTLVIVTADHGHTNTKYYVLTNYPNIIKMLKRPTSLEPRATVFFVKDEYKEEFPKEFKKTFGKEFILFSKEEVIQKQLFGDGTPHKKFNDFIGDYLTVAISDKGIVYSKNSHLLVSNHSGMTEKEIQIPLIIFKCNN